MHIRHLLFHRILLGVDISSKLLHDTVNLIFHLTLDFIHDFGFAELGRWRRLTVWMAGIWHASGDLSRSCKGASPAGAGRGVEIGRGRYVLFSSSLFVTFLHGAGPLFIHLLLIHSLELFVFGLFGFLFCFESFFNLALLLSNFLIFNTLTFFFFCFFLFLDSFLLCDLPL